MFRISKLADYATVIMGCFAHYPNQLLSAKFIAEFTGIGEATVAKNLKQLTRQNLLISQRGAAGGYSLARLPGEILLVDIIQAIDGDISMTTCSSDHEDCQFNSTCKLKLNWRRVNDTLVASLSTFTLTDMIQSPFQVSTVRVADISVRQKELVDG